MPSPRNILIVAGEASGDRHAARLAAMIRRRVPDATFWGIGGELLRAKGMEILVDSDRMNVIGFVEVVKRYRFFRSVFNRILAAAGERRPSVAILVDYPGFNLRLARALHAAGIRVLYYIAPQVWAWKEGRVRTLREAVDDLIVAFPFEVGYFERHGITAHFFGHPLVDQLAERTAAAAPARADDERPVIAYLPGSRPEEIGRHMPILVDVMRNMGPGYRHVIPQATTIRRDLLEHYGAAAAFDIVPSAYEALAGARAALVKSGTSTLDATLLGVPFAVFYRTSALSYRIAKRLIRVPHIAMTNVLAGRAVVREFVQEDAQAANLGAELERLLAPGAYRDRVVSDLQSVAQQLGAPGAAERAAAFITEHYLT